MSAQNLAGRALRGAVTVTVSPSSCKQCYWRSHCRRKRQAHLVRAAAGEKEVDVDPKVPLISSKDTGPLPYPIDNESFQDLMGFTGSAPEELIYGQSVTEQALAHPISATFLGIILSVASVAPKFVSGVALNELHDAASRDGLPPALRFFNKTHEIWLGRVAMIGLLGLGGLEVFLGHALFRRG